MNTLRSALVLVFALTLSGCFQTQTLLRLNADGSGTVEETVLMNSAMAMVALFGAGIGQVGTMGDEPYTEADLLDRAEAIGATFVGVEEQDLLFGTGYVATYSFDDIQDLTLTSDPSAYYPEEMREEMMDDLDLGLGMGEPYRFAYDGATLTIHIPQPDPEDFGNDEVIEEPVYNAPAYPGRDPKKQPLEPEMEVLDSETDAEMMAGMAIIFGDMRFTVAVELPSDVSETNASFLDGRRLTLYDLNFEQLIEDPDAFERLEEIAPGGPPDVSMALQLLSQIPGFTFEAEPTVTVSLR